jgi:hypothetical protein
VRLLLSRATDASSFSSLKTATACIRY